MARSSGSAKGNRGRAAASGGKPTPSKNKAPSNKAPAKKAPAKKVSSKPKGLGFPVVGIGASAGGCEAITTFLDALPADPGFALVVVMHLDPERESHLTEVLQRHSAVPIEEVTGSTQVRVNHAYVIPPGHYLTLAGGRLMLTPLPPKGTIPRPIDALFGALASEQGAAAVAVVLSGLGSDGTLGLRAVKAAGGLVLVQDQQSALYHAMPRSAVATGLVDLVASPERMPAQIIACAGRPPTVEDAVEAVVDDREAFTRILALLRARTGCDFSLYKPTTIQRRIERRMSLHLVADLEQYARLVEHDDEEARSLFKELLIRVTSFFRDPAAFEALHAAVTELVATKQDGQAVRAWVPGCSTGEEAYSVAMVIGECIQAAGKHLTTQVFGTDVDDDAIDIARGGLYPSSIAADVPAGLLDRCFVREQDGGYRVSKPIRDLLVFATQDVTKDPPFSRLDLVSCRNLLIYLGPTMQRRLLSVFHYALQPAGLLLLGSAESVEAVPDLYAVVDRRWKLFGRRPAGGSRGGLALPADVPPAPAEPAPGGSRSASPRLHQNNRLLRAILHHSATAPCVVIDQQLNVAFTHGRTGRFLEPPEGRASMGLLEMARPGLKSSLAVCVRRAVRSGKEAVRRGVSFRANGDRLTVDLVVKPIPEGDGLAGMTLVFFEVQLSEAVAEVAEVADPARSSTGAASDVEELERLLNESQEGLRSTIVELEASSEEQQAANEELQATNEELQAANEELQTSKEELQALNEEAATVNAELQSRLSDLARVNDDLKNLLDSTGTATVFLDVDLNVRRFTPGVTELIPLTQADAGRSIGHFAIALEGIDLAQLAGAVLDDLVIREQEAATAAGRVFLIKARAYRTTLNVIDGVVLTFEDQTELKLAQAVLEGKVETGAAALAKRTRELAEARGDVSELSGKKR